MEKCGCDAKDEYIYNREFLGGLMPTGEKRVTFCRFHAAAGDAIEALEQLRDWCRRRSVVYGSEIWDLDQIAEKVILKAKGE